MQVVEEWISEGKVVPKDYVLNFNMAKFAYRFHLVFNPDEQRVEPLSILQPSQHVQDMLPSVLGQYPFHFYQPMAVLCAVFSILCHERHP